MYMACEIDKTNFINGHFTVHTRIKKIVEMSVNFYKWPEKMMPQKSGSAPANNWCLTTTVPTAEMK